MKEKIVNLIADHVEGMTAEEIATFIEIPPKQELGDYAFLASDLQRLCIKHQI